MQIQIGKYIFSDTPGGNNSGICMQGVAFEFGGYIYISKAENDNGEREGEITFLSQPVQVVIGTEDEINTREYVKIAGLLEELEDGTKIYVGFIY